MTSTTAAKKTATRKTSANKTASNTSTTNDGFTADERAAMKERARELRTEAKGAKDRAKGEADLLAKVAEMPDADRILAERIHSIVTENAPELMPKTWYGMPAYANAEGKVVCFFQAAAKFEARYATLGFNDSANLDDGTMWPTAFAVTELTPAQVKLIAMLVKKSVA